MSGESEGALMFPIVFFIIILLAGTVYIVSWLSKRSKVDKETTKTQVKGPNPHPKTRGSAPRPIKKKVPLPKGGSTVQHKFEHPHLLATLKGHTGQLTGGEFSAGGKQFITSAEVVRACPYDVPSVQDSASLEKSYKAINHSEDGSHWMNNSPNSSNAPSDTEDSHTSSSSSGSRMTRRQRKNKRKKGKNVLWDSCDKISSNNKISNKINNNNNSISFENIIVENNIHKNRNKKLLHSNVPQKKSDYQKLRCWGKSDVEFHKLLLPLCINVQERILSGYPYQTYRGTYVFKSFGFSRLEAVLGDHRLVDAEIQDIHLKHSNELGDEDSTSQNFMQHIGDNDFNGNNNDFTMVNNFKKCMRCRQYFDVFGNGKTLCFFHPKKSVLTSDGYVRYTCCNSDKNGAGCLVYNYHVFHHLALGINGPLPGFVSTQPIHRPPRVYGLDCEMVFTSLGFEVARATLVNVCGEPLLDVFVLPEGEVFDYNTQFSGITQQHLTNAFLFRDVQRMILDIVSSSDILVGHSLEGDLVVLKILHRRVVDTSLVFKEITEETNSQGGSPLPRKQALKSLVKEHLGQDIQTGGSSGHNSIEDATAALNLILSRVCGASRENQRIEKIPSTYRSVTA